MASEETAPGKTAHRGTADGDTAALQRLTALLTAATDTAPTARELAELLWLARQSDDEEPAGREAAPAEGDSGSTTAAAPPTPPPPPFAPPARQGEAPARVPLRLPAATPPPPPATGTAGDTTPLLAPAPPMLPHPLALQRALRPLKRTVPAARARLLDERATADRIARLGAHPDVWLPVLRPARDRWLRLNLVHDTGPTMPVWRPLVRELHTALAQSGVFRTVTLHPAGPDGGARHVPDPGDGRTVTLVVSDCMGPQWRPGPAGGRWYRTLRHWSTRMPLAVVQPLPERLWPTTALPAEPGVLTSPAAAAPLTAVTFIPYDPESAPPPGPAVPLPVLEPGAPWLANWAALVASPGGARTPGAVAWLPPAPLPAGAAPSPTALPAQDLVLRFRATASPEAFRLAGHLALAVPSVPVMRLVQRAVDRDPRPQHLAEVILSGMLTAVPGPPGSYDFRPGVRDLLLRTLPRTTRGRTRELLERIGGLIDERAGLTAGGFRAEAAVGKDAGTGPAFATVSEETVRRLAGPAQQRGADPLPRPSAPPRSPDDGAHPSHTRTTLGFRTDTDLSAHPESRITLEYAVHQVLSRGALTPQQYELDVHPDGYSVRVLPGTDLLPVLVAALRWLPDHWATLARPPRLRVGFGTSTAVGSDSPLLIVVSTGLYDSYTASSAASGPYRFHPLYDDRLSPAAWYHPGSERADLLKGPLVTADLTRLGIPTPGRTAVVHTRPEGPLTLLNPADPYDGHPPRPVTYYEVDLTPRRAVHQVTLPSSGKGGFTAALELTWRVTDPVAYVRTAGRQVGERLLAHFLNTAPSVTRHHSLRRAAGAQRAVNSQLGRWPVPGLTVTCTATLAPDYAPPPQVARPAPAARPLSELLADAETVLFGFDGPLTRLFTATTAREAALDLLALVAEHRGPEDGPAGRPPGDAGTAREVFAHPLDVLRAFARDRLGPILRARLDELELRAVPDAPTTHHSVALVRALHDTGRRIGVATDVCEQAVHRHLESYRLPLLAGVHGRAGDLGRLMPHPDCLQRALRTQGAPAHTGVLIGSTLAELTAAQQVGLRFIGLARNPTVEQGLREAGCEATVPSLTPVLEAARTL
ncbi:SAV_2336 N-terminal domain-related protein [Streptomyces sp. NPDC049687]|uniref:SAV_2336 N-terminal domain-related protein n=1 Tax=Streptomyces sp. NPDC049687 TaxID=3365596 RepID=UPI0037BD407E